MDEYLMDLKEAAVLLEEVVLPLPKFVVCYYIGNNLSKEYEVIKQMILNDKTMPLYSKVEFTLLTNEVGQKLEA